MNLLYHSIFSNPTLALILSVLALYLGPAIHSVFKPKAGLLNFIDGFTLTVIAGLVLIHIIPDAFEDIGWASIAIVCFGLFFPSLLEKGYHKFAKQAHVYTLLIALIGLCAHAITDGLALISPNFPHNELASSQNFLPFAIILHNLPVGLAVWWLIKPTYGNKRAVSMLLLMSASTVIGFFAGQALIGSLPHSLFGIFEAFVAGTLLHVFFHRHEKFETLTTDHHGKPRWAWTSGLGALAGMGLLFLIYFSNREPNTTGTLSILYQLALQSAPALLIGYLIAGLIEPFLPKASVSWMQKGSRVSQAARGMAFGLPLPICSCGVVPVYRTLVQQGLPLSAALAFFVATPELGLDAFLLSLPLLGSQLAIIRLVCAGLVAIIIGWGVSKLFPSQAKNKGVASNPDRFANLGIFQKIIGGVKTGLQDVVDHTGPWIVVGLTVAALVQPYLPQIEFLKSLPHSLEIPLFALIGMPVYVCASGITPFVAVLVASGVSPGAAVALLLTGPATNITTFGVLSSLHGRKVAIAFGLGMILLAVSSGYIVNFFFPSVNTPELFHSHDHGASSFKVFALAALSLIYLAAILRRGPRYLINQIVAFDSKNVGEEKKKQPCCH